MATKLKVKDNMKKLTRRSVPIGTVPNTVEEGRYLMHNQVRHDADTPAGENGFRAWTDSQVPGDFLACPCGWAGLPHYAHKQHSLFARRHERHVVQLRAIPILKGRESAVRQATKGDVGPLLATHRKHQQLADDYLEKLYKALGGKEGSQVAGRLQEAEAFIEAMYESVDSNLRGRVITKKDVRKFIGRQFHIQF